MGGSDDRAPARPRGGGGTAEKDRKS